MSLRRGNESGQRSIDGYGYARPRSPCAWGVMGVGPDAKSVNVKRRRGAQPKVACRVRGLCIQPGKPRRLTGKVGGNIPGSRPFTARVGRTVNHSWCSSHDRMRGACRHGIRTPAQLGATGHSPDDGRNVSGSTIARIEHLFYISSVSTVERSPRKCPNGHAFMGCTCLVGWEVCGCPQAENGGHRTHYCRICGETVRTPPCGGSMPQADRWN